MNKSIFIMGAIALCSIQCMGQKFFTRNGHLGFFSKTNMEDIKANNESVTYIMDLSTGEINISALQTNFQFEKALMQEHYNENYVESSKFPKAIFKGKIDDMSKVNFKMEGVYNAKKHPDVIAGRATAQQILQQFLDTFDVGGEVDGKVTLGRTVAPLPG
jgi:hypothetical protein